MNPHIVFYSSFGIPSKKFDGYSWGPIIFIRPYLKGNEPFLIHEQTHSKQFWRTFGTHGIWYMVSKKYRLKSELEAYGNQIKKRVELGMDPDYNKYSEFLASYYNLGITEAQAFTMLRIEVENK